LQIDCCADLRIGSLIWSLIGSVPLVNGYPDDWHAGSRVGPLVDSAG